MPTDIHTHVGEYPEHFGEGFATDLRAAWGPNASVGTKLPELRRVIEGLDKVVVLGFQAPPSGASVPNDYVAEFVREQPDRVIGFGSVDPHDPKATVEIERMKFELGLRGCKMGPIYQHADPLGVEFKQVCRALERLDLPMLIHQGTTFVRNGPLRYALPILLDELARDFPRLTMVIAHMGHPWIDESVCVMRKHPNVYADISAMHPRPWQLYNALRAAVEYRVDHKLLFGSDYPFFTPEETMAGLRAVGDLARQANLPEIGEDVIEGIIHRPSLELIGID